MTRPIVRMLRQWIERPDLPDAVRALAPEELAALVKRVGLEDAGEILPYASSAQLVAAFDEDLFQNDRPGEREVFDAGRFATWLEVLLEAGPERAAARVAELSESFVAHALSSLVLVLDHDALLARLAENDDDARRVDKALESSLCEEIDGYLLVARVHEGWDAVLALVLALDRDHRALLERLLDRCVRAHSGLADDLDELCSALSEAESLEEDALAEREDRRAAQGYVEPRMARAFLASARRADLPPDARDPLTRAYFRELERPPVRRGGPPSSAPGALALALPAPRRYSAVARGAASEVERSPLAALSASTPAELDARLEELAFLTNVLVAGAEGELGRLRPIEAARAALATVWLGARERARRTKLDPAGVLAATPADVLFREGSRALIRRDAGSRGFLLGSDAPPPGARALGPKRPRAR